MADSWFTAVPADGRAAVAGPPPVLVAARSGPGLARPAPLVLARLVPLPNHLHIPAAVRQLGLHHM